MRDPNIGLSKKIRIRQEEERRRRQQQPSAPAEKASIPKPSYHHYLEDPPPPPAGSVQDTEEGETTRKPSYYQYFEPSTPPPSYYQYFEPSTTPPHGVVNGVEEVETGNPIPPSHSHTQPQQEPGAYASGGGGGGNLVVGNLDLQDGDYYSGATTTSDEVGGVDPQGLQEHPQARLVQDDEDPTTQQAEELDPATLAEREADNKRRKGKERIFIALFVFLICLALSIVFGTIFGQPNKDKKRQEKSATVSPSLAPTGAPSYAPSGSLELLVESLPEYTLVNLNNISTPQWKAMDWLSRHPEIPTMEEKRKLQLFAMATFYYSMDGPNWYKPVRERWMLISKDECAWYNSEFGTFYQQFGVDEYHEWERGFSGFPPCNQYHEIQSLFLQTRDDLTPALNSPLLPPEIALLTSLVGFNLNYNGLRASINDFFPSQFYHMTNMVSLNLQGNFFTGTIPSELALLTNMVWIKIDQNSLTGQIPSEFGLMTKLEHLALYWNGDPNSQIPPKLGLNGQIPSELGLASMKTLNIGGNSLSGSIPTELAKLTDMWSFQAYYNNLTGTVPQELEALAMNGVLRTVALHNNSLTGTIPEGLCSLGVLENRPSPIMGHYFSYRFNLGLSFDCNDQLCGCCWCPCPGSNYSATGDECHVDQDKKFREDKDWPGAFPVVPSNARNAIAINVRADEYPAQTAFDWSVQDEESGLWNMTHSVGLPVFGKNMVHSYTIPVASNALYRLQLHDQFGDGTCCWWGLGWFTITNSVPSFEYANGTVVWEATGFDLQFMLVVFLWVDSHGIAHQVEYIPGEGYALVQEDKEPWEDPAITVIVIQDDKESTSSGKNHSTIVVPDIAVSNATSFVEDEEESSEKDDSDSAIGKVDVEETEP